MSRNARTLAAAALGMSLLVARPAAAAQDHLKCYKIKDPQAKVKYTATLDGLTVESGCTIKVPGKLLCVPAEKSSVTPTPPGGGGTGEPNRFVCYKVKCPKATVPPLAVSDQFGTRSVTPGTTKYVCAPVAGPPTTTTSTSATTTTTTTLPAVACCQLTISATPACFDATGADAAIKCPALGGTLSVGPACDGISGNCGTKNSVPLCCECPAPGGFPHPQYCYESAALTAALGVNCPVGCTLVTMTCGQNTESCGGL